MNIPNNSLTEEITEIVTLCKTLETEYGNDAFCFNPPASENDIAEWENNHKITIPKSYKEWLEFSNGSHIINNTAQFFGINNLKIYNDCIPDDYVVIGELIGDGEVLCFSKTTQKIIRYNHGKTIEYKHFKEILNLILDII